MATRTRTDRRGVRERAVAAAAGITAAALVAGGGWLLLREDDAPVADLDEAEMRVARDREPVTPATPSEGDVRLPVDAPFSPPGARAEYRIVADGPQAAAYGLPPERVRTWGFSLPAGSDPARLRREITAALEAAGGTLDPVQVVVPGSDFTTLTGTWDGMLLVVVAHRSETIAVTLVDR